MKQTSVLQFIEKERAEGKTNAQVKHDLLEAGWHMDIIKHAMGELKKDHPTPQPIVEPKKISPKQLLGIGIVGIVSLVLLVLYI